MAFEPKQFLETLTHAPGVYQMLDPLGKILYVGKARDLKNRLKSYFGSGVLPKTAAMVAKIASITVTVTTSEKEALLLEASLIKTHQPRYNILLKDDKSYPFLFLTQDKTPQFTYKRQSKVIAGSSFGPYPSVQAARLTQQLIYKLFRLRQCEDSFFKSRTRPCLQYQINRCSAPCVGKISHEEYQKDVQSARDFLEGKKESIVESLAVRMTTASQDRNYELAARLRDEIALLRQILEKQSVVGPAGEVDVLALEIGSGLACIHLLCVREGDIKASESFVMECKTEVSEEAIMEAFVQQRYLGDALISYPKRLMCSVALSEIYQEALTQAAGFNVVVSGLGKGRHASWAEMAHNSAKEALKIKLSSKTLNQTRYQDMITALALDHPPTRLECFDVSHTLGQQTIASCVVFNEDGPLKAEYRKYRIESATPGDDCGALEEALTKRFKKLLQEEKPLLDLLFVDGGKAQTRRAQQVLQACQLTQIKLVGIAKGEGRKSGLETLFSLDWETDELQELQLGMYSEALHFINYLRDEAHRFAIKAHRKERAKASVGSVLEQIPGIGPKRRQALLVHFGGLQGLTAASVQTIANVEGITMVLAQRIYNVLHQQED